VGNIFMPTEHAMNLGIIYRVLKEDKLVYAYDDNVRRMWEKSALFKIMESREIYDINIKR